MAWSVNGASSPKSFAEARFALYFLAIFLLLQGLYQGIPQNPFATWLVNTVTVEPGVFWLQQLYPGDAVIADAHRVRSRYIKLSVLNGCEGSEVWFLWIAAVLAFRAAWGRRLLALAVGSLAVWAFNQVRLVGLYGVLRAYPQWFDAVHSWIAPSLLVAVTALMYLYWVRGIALPARPAP